MKIVMTIFVILALQVSAFADDDVVDTESCSSARGKKITRYIGDLGSVFISEEGITRNGEFYPFDREEVVNDDRTVGLRTNKVVETHFAVDLRRTKSAIVFVEAYRRQKQGGKEASNWTWAQSFFTSDFSNFPKIYKFRQSVLFFDRSQKIARATYVWVNHYDKQNHPDYDGGVVHPDLVTPEVTVAQLSDPNLLNSELYKPFLPYIKNLDPKFGHVYEDILSLSSCQQ